MGESYCRALTYYENTFIHVSVDMHLLNSSLLVSVRFAALSRPAKTEMYIGLLHLVHIS